MMAFQYYEVRPVIRDDGTARAYDDEASFFEAYHALASHTGALPEAFWSIYGRYDDGEGGSMVQCIGDFGTKANALEILNAILAIPARARDMLDAGALVRSADDMAASIRVSSAMLDDMINQSSNAERL